MLTRLSIRLKVLVAPLIVMLLCALVCAAAVALLQSQGRAFREVVGTAFDTATASSRMSLAVARIHSDLVRQLQLGEDNEAARADLRAQLPARFEKVEAMLQSIETHDPSVDADLLHSIGEILAVYRIVAAKAVQDKPSPVLVSSLLAHYSQLDAYLGQLADLTIRAAKQRQQVSERLVARSVQALLAGLAAAFAISLLVTWAIGRAISAPIQQMTGVMSRLAQGEHEVDVPARERRDEVGRMAQALEAFRQANETLRRHEVELAQLVERLAVLRDEAAAASRAKSEFLASMSHELRTPLNAVLGYAQLLQWNPATLSDLQHTGLKTIEQAGQHLLELIDEILDLSRIEAGRLELHGKAVSLAPFLQAIANIIRVRVEQKDVAFSMACEGLPDAVVVDERRLRQVLLNLLSNAAKFTDAGVVTLAVQAAAGRDPHHVRLRFAVRDTGIGISPEGLASLFQPFQQLGDETRRRGGTGLGLVISQQLVQHMGGRLQVSSEPGRGSEFAFELELPRAAAEVPGGPRRSASGYEGPRKHLLVVDDVPQNRKLLADMLQPLGFRIEEAANGEEGLARAEAERPDLILMDCVMPVLGGLDTTRRLRERPGLSGVPVIAISASALNDGERRALDAGANAFLTKPFRAEDLLALLERHLAIRFLRE